MDIEVDQSRKVEETGDTVLSFSDDITYAIIVPDRVKQAAFRCLRARRKTRKVAIIWLFAACVFLLIRDHLHTIRHVTIDVEYAGKEADIKGILLMLIHRERPSFARDGISLMRIGKKSPAHVRAWAVHRGCEQADRVITEAELLALLQ